jgi:hypothetical protein
MLPIAITPLMVYNQLANYASVQRAPRLSDLGRKRQNSSFALLVHPKSDPPSPMIPLSR